MIRIIKRKKFAGILSSLAVSADGLISFYDEMDFNQEIDSETNEEVLQKNTDVESKPHTETLEDKMKLKF